MASQTNRSEAILDGGVLTNFLQAGRVDLISSHPRYHFVITRHVMEEIQRFFPDLVPLLSSELQTDRIRYTSMGAEEELLIFARLTEVWALGRGECACLATAIHRRMPVAIDDHVARRTAVELYGFEKAFGTKEILVDWIRSGGLQVEAADDLIQTFRELGVDLPFKSFLSVL